MPRHVHSLFASGADPKPTGLCPSDLKPKSFFQRNAMMMAFSPFTRLTGANCCNFFTSALTKHDCLPLAPKVCRARPVENRLFGGDRRSDFPQRNMLPDCHRKVK